MRARWPASILFLFLTCLLVTGCKTHYNFYSDPVPLPQEEKPIDEPVRLALVLGAGGARGMAHVGVLEEFERAGISVDLIVGCSAGSLVGALYADNPNAGCIKQLLYSLRRKDFLDYSLMQCRFGFVQGNHLRTLLKRTMDKEHFADLDIKLVITATDLISGELITLNGGEVAPAVHASCAVPFYFRPVQLYGRILVDGGVVDPIPVNIAQTYNPKIIIAVDLTKNLPDTFPRNLFGVAKRSLEILIHNQSRRSIESADVVIQPQLPPMGLFDEGFEECLYESGRHAAQCAIPMIKEKLAQRSNHESEKSSIQESRVYPLKIYR